MADVLIVTDREQDLLVLVRGLEAGGHRIQTAPPTAAQPVGIEAIVVDAAKDIAAGRDLCRGYRSTSSRIPLIAIVASEDIEAIAPDWQIDTFLIEPVSVPEALARLRVALGSHVLDTGGAIRVGDLTIDPDSYQVRLRGRPLDLTYKEFQLLLFLASSPGRVYSRQQLLQEVWGYDFFGGTRTVDVHVRRLRAKLGAEYEHMIVTIRNVGYKVEAHRAH